MMKKKPNKLIKNITDQLNKCTIVPVLKKKIRYICKNIGRVNITDRNRLYKILSSTEGLFPVTEAVWVIELEHQLRKK